MAASRRLTQFALVMTVAAALAAAGCASGLGGGTYQRTEARRTMTVQFGTVESVRPVLLEGTKTPVGAGAGAAVGGLAGSTIGHGRGAAAGAILGAVAGGLAGAVIEEGVTRRPGVEITVRLEGGSYLAVVQEDEGEQFRPGERVRLLRDGGTTRVTR